MEPVELTVQGTRVYGEHHAPARGSAVGAAVLVHGLNSSLHEFGGLPGRLAASGLHVLAFDQRGFGASAGERGRTGLDRVLPEVDAARAYLRAAAGKDVPMALVGHSLGGSMVLGVLARREGYRAAVVAHPLRRLMDELSVAERAGYHVLGRWNRRRMRSGRPSVTVPYKITHRHILNDPSAREAARKAPFLQRRVNVGNYDFAATMDAVEWATNVRVPTLCVHGDGDRVVDPEHSREVFAALPGPKETMEHSGGHSCFLDGDRERVLEGTTAFLVRHLDGDGE